MVLLSLWPYTAMMTQVLVTLERAAILCERLKKKFAERQAAKVAFASMCEKIATEPRSSYGKEFALSFDEVNPELGRQWSSVPASGR
jgi:hypothetical protein